MSDLEPHYRDVDWDGLPPIERNPVYVVLDNLRSAYNVGSAFRTSDAAAVAHVYLCGMSAHPPHSKLEKTALGAHSYIPWSYFERTADALAVLKEKGIPIIGIEAIPGATSHYEFAWPRPVAVVFGNEVNGIPERVLSQCDAVVRIPMFGYKNSINVATAFGIILYEIVRQWKTG